MELNASINTFHKGLNLDSDISVLDSNTLRYAENIRLVANGEGTSAVAQNSDYIQKCNFKLPSTVEKVLGTVETKYSKYVADQLTVADCAVIFTKNSQNSSYTNSIYRIDFNESVNDSVCVIAEGNFGWEDTLSLVSNYESFDVSNVYVADGKNALRVVNIAETYSETDDTVFDMFPTVNLSPFKFEGFTVGNLKAGKVQYTYQLFNEHGTSGALSPLSGIISISSTINNDSSKNTKGSQPNKITQLGINLQTTFVNNGFDRARIYRISYNVAGQVPVIDIIDEIKIDKTYELQQLNYTDFGSSYLSTITVDEFNNLTVPYNFTAQTIESKDNRLFAANIKEDTWDFEYDARAYRGDADGNVILKDASKGDIEFTFEDGIPEIDAEHDCLNPSNLIVFDTDSFKYVYNNEGKLGGTGKNISYEFSFVEVVPSAESTEQNKIADNLKIDAGAVASTTVTYFDENRSAQTTKEIPEIKVRNYSDAYMCNNFVGYQRDEIYRFGIVFYNKKGIATPVHWIGDIRIPCSKNMIAGKDSNKDSITYPFHLGAMSEAYDQTVELLSYAVGIKFQINLDALDENVSSYEIVRCERTGENRTIVTQAIMSSLVEEKGYDNIAGKEKDNWLKTNGIGDKGIYPQFLFNLSKVFNTWAYNSGVSRTQYHYVSDNYYELVSPEICVSQENTANLIGNGLLCRMYGNYATEEVFSDSPQKLSVRPTKLYELDGTVREDKLNSDGTFDVTYMPIYFQFSHGTDEKENIYNTYLYTAQRWDFNYSASNVFKYYGVVHENYIEQNHSIESVIAPKQIIEIADRQALRSTQTAIGNKSYMNLSVGVQDQYGRHGKNLVIKTESSFADDNPYFDVFHNYDASYSIMNTAAIYNVKQNSKLFSSGYSERINSVYISCNAHQTKSDETSDQIYCFGGDTYLGVLDYLNTAVHQKTNDYNVDVNERFHTQCYIPFETTVNLNLLSNEQYHNTVSDNGMSAENRIQSEPVAFSSYVQEEPQYVYNTVYSQQPNAVKFVPKLMYSYDDLSTPNRIIVSEVKTNLEVSDSWMVFKYANYLDVDNKYGPITNLKTFGDKLYFFQDNAVGIASVNERSLITDNTAQLTLGTGTVLSRYDYLDTTNGDSIINDKSIVNSASTLYWYDYNKNELCAINNSVIELSKVKQVQSYFNSNEDLDRSKPVSLFNKKYNEIWFKLFDQSLVFNEQLNVFTSFYTHDYDHALQFGNKLITLRGQDFYEHNETIDVSKSVEPLISKIQFVVNDKYPNTKVFDNVSFDADFKDNVNNITQVYFTTKSQTSNTINADNIECREDNYRFPIPRELEIENTMSYAGRMRGKYLTHFYTFDCNDSKSFKIPYIKTTYRQSLL